MSNDDWNNPNNRPGGSYPPSSSPQQNDQGWNHDSDLPKPGESWDTAHEPRPIHEVDDNWGTAAPNPNPSSPYDGSVQSPPQPQTGFGQPQSPPPMQGGPGYQPNAPYNPQGNPNPMVYQPNQAMTSQSLDNNDILAIVLSVFFPGVGHMMLGQVGKGIAIIAAMFLSCGILAILWPVVIIDTVMIAQARKKRPIGDWEFFPK